MRTFVRLVCLAVTAAVMAVPFAQALEKQPASAYHARRVALGVKLKGGAALLFASHEPEAEYLFYRQDEDFYYLTGWNEPGAALLVVGGPTAAADGTISPSEAKKKYEEILFLPERNRRMELYTGEKVDAATPGATEKTGVDEVRPLVDMPKMLHELAAAGRLTGGVWEQPGNASAKALDGFTAVVVGAEPSERPTQDVTKLVAELRVVKDDGEIALMKKAATASNAGQRAMMRAVKPGATELAVEGKMTEAWMEHGCERYSYPPIVGSGINSTVLHYSENSDTMQDGDVVVVDAACEYSMYGMDITRTVPVNGHFTPRQREIYDIVLGAQKAAVDAFVAGKTKILDWTHTDPDAVDTVAYNYINTHGKSKDGKPLGKYWEHGVGHMVGIDVHDPADYPAVLKPGMVFTIEPGIYIPEEKIGVRIECTFLVAADGKLIDLNADLPHTADEVEAFMKGK